MTLQSILFADSNLLPYTRYQYKLFSSNKAGEISSKWSSPTLTGEAAPDQIATPTFSDIGTRSLMVIASEPLLPNGIVRSYTIYLQKNGSHQDFTQVRILSSYLFYSQT